MYYTDFLGLPSFASFVFHPSTRACNSLTLLLSHDAPILGSI